MVIRRNQGIAFASRIGGFRQRGRLAGRQGPRGGAASSASRSASSTIARRRWPLIDEVVRLADVRRRGRRSRAIAKDAITFDAEPAPVAAVDDQLGDRTGSGDKAVAQAGDDWVPGGLAGGIAGEPAQATCRARPARRPDRADRAGNVRDPRVRAATLITVTRVELNVDLSVATVYVSIIGGRRHRRWARSRGSPGRRLPARPGGPRAPAAARAPKLAVPARRVDRHVREARRDQSATTRNRAREAGPRVGRAGGSPPVSQPDGDAGGDAGAAPASDKGAGMNRSAPPRDRSAGGVPNTEDMLPARRAPCLRGAERVLAHQSTAAPTATVTGSMAGLASPAPRRRGKTAVIYSVDPIARRYKCAAAGVGSTGPDHPVRRAVRLHGPWSTAPTSRCLGDNAAAARGSAAT